MSNIYRSMYFRILCSLFFNKYVPVCHPSDRNINWRPQVQEETYPMQVKEHDNNLHDYLWAFIRQTSVFNLQLLVILENLRERAREHVAVHIKIRKAHVSDVPCAPPFFHGNFIYTNWYAMLNQFNSDVCVDPILPNALREPIHFQNIYFFPNNRRKK